MSCWTPTWSLRTSEEIRNSQHYAALRAQRREAQLILIRDFMQTATLLLPDQNTCERDGQVKAELAGIGKLIPENDIWIAAMARQSGLPLVTRDAHFAAVSALVTWADSATVGPLTRDAERA